MSLILDALRKIEQQRRTSRQGVMDIRSDVLNYHGRTAPHKKSRLIPLAGLAMIAVIAALIFYILRQEPSDLEGGRMTTPPVAPQPTPHATSSPAPQPAVSQPKLEPPQKASAYPTRPETSAAIGNDSMVISGIAWQEERSLRRAVINGVLAGEGAEILGARIVEIREDGVIFSRSGRIFEMNYAGGAGR